MIYSYLLNIGAPLANALGRTFLMGRLNPPLTLALALVLAAITLPGIGQVHAQEAAAATAPVAVNINSADAATLAANLRGVGQSRALEIVRYREAYGPFSSVDELAEVKGIGKSTLDENRALITLE